MAVGGHTQNMVFLMANIFIKIYKHLWSSGFKVIYTSQAAKQLKHTEAKQTKTYAANVSCKFICHIKTNLEE